MFISSGQILPMNTLSISRQVELIYEHIKYKLQVENQTFDFVFHIIIF